LDDVFALQVAGPDSDMLSFWAPNSSLIMGGDTSLLFYDVGGVAMAAPSADPIFAANITSPHNPDFGLFYPPDVTVPIVCDTKYVLCTGSKDHCSSPGGYDNLVQWVGGRTIKGHWRENSFWLDIGTFIAGALVVPPINRVAMGSATVLASQTTIKSQIQILPHMATAQRELTRLVEASMFMLASFMPLSAVGHWDAGNGTDGFFNVSRPASICNNIITESSKAATIPVKPYVVLVVLLIFTGLLGRMHSVLPRRLLSTTQRILHDAFVLFGAGQLHREVTERIWGRFVKVDTAEEFPTVDTLHLGPLVVCHQGVQRFGQGDDISHNILADDVEL
jgi:hypothetical protein